MAKRVVWTRKARLDRFAILKYWQKRNKSNTYSKKLNKLFTQSAIIISKYPEIGKRTDIENVRAKIIKEYLLFYEIAGQEIIVLTIIDGRRDPNLISKRISK
jgi:toxin YoeB